MADRNDDARDKRQGDVLGLGGITGGTPHGSTAAPESEEARRRRRMREGADHMTGPEDVTDATPRGAGATSIDMGAGGEGTDIEP
jgi:hypothetical protein